MTLFGLPDPNTADLTDSSNAEHAEGHINECRNALREEHIVNISQAKIKE